MGHNKRPATLRIGTYAEGTCKAEEWIAGLTWEMDRIRMSRTDRSEYRKLKAEYDAIPSTVTGSTDEAMIFIVDHDENMGELLNDMITIAESYLPDYTYLGTLEGDGAHFGVWIDREVLESPRHSQFDGLHVNDLSEVPSTYSGHVLHVNDHGNATLYSHYRGRFKCLWAIV